MKTRIPRRFAWALGLTLGLPPALFAQTTPAASSDGAIDVEEVVLDVFTVNTDTDRGYIAVDSLAGGRTNTALKFTPAAISSLTRTFIDDLGIQDVREALRWAPNVVPADRNAGRGFGGSAFHDWSFNYRGAGAGQQGGPGPSRNYFSFYQNADSYNIERIEFLRGPNALVFGLGTVGGTLSTYTKIPRVDKDFTSITTVLDDNGSLRFELDFNRGLTDAITMRLNAVHDDKKGWRENDEGRTRGVDLAVLFKLSNNTTFRVEGEFVQIDRTLISTVIGDKMSGWDGTTSSETWGAAPVGPARTEPIQNAGGWGDWLNQYWVYIPGQGTNSLLPWAGGRASTTSGSQSWFALPVAPTADWYPSQAKFLWEGAYTSLASIPVLPKKSWTYGSGKSEIEYKNITAFLDHRFNKNLDVSLSAYRYLDEVTAKDYEGTGGAAIDINRQLPNGLANPNYGKAYADFFLSKQDQSRTVTEARLQMNYHFETEVLGTTWKQRFTASTSAGEKTIRARQNLAQVDNGPLASPGDWVQNMVWGRIYLDDDANQKMNIPRSISSIVPDGDGGTTTREVEVFYGPKADGYWFDFDDTFKPRDVAFLSHTRLFEDSLSILAGVRRDSYKENIRELRRGPNLADKISNESQSGTSISFGGTYYIKWFGLFANYSENIQPPSAGSQPLLTGVRPNPETGKGLDYGIRVSTEDGKYYATLGRYDSESKGHLVENPIGLRTIWQRYFDAQPALTRDPNLNDLAYSDSTSRDVQGYEFEITANPTQSLRIQANFGKPDATIVDYYPGARRYFADNLATWQAGVAAADTPDHAQALSTSMSDVQNALNQTVEGAKVGGLVKYTASFFANYTFLGDRLKGWSIGGGMAYAGKAYSAIYDDETYRADSVRTTSAVIAYDTRFGENVQARFAVNIENVLGDDDPLVTSYYSDYVDEAGTRLPSGYSLPTPRTIRFTARFTF